jgi:hypothetical protein
MSWYMRTHFVVRANSRNVQEPRPCPIFNRLINLDDHYNSKASVDVLDSFLNVNGGYGVTGLRGEEGGRVVLGLHKK